MSVGSRAKDDRRRRRLAVAGEGVLDAAEWEGSALAVLRERSIVLPSASPWLPRARWRRFMIGGIFWLLLCVVAGLLIQPIPPHPQLAPAVNHLVGGRQPILGVYAEILLWTLAASLATLVGWFRSHSQLDFRGRYRLWAWPALVFAGWGFCAGTGIHSAVGAVAGPQLRWPIWRAEIVVWLVPAMAAGLSVWWVIGRDLRRSRLNSELARLSVIVLLLTGVGHLYQPEFSHLFWWQGALIAGQYLGLGLLITGLWLHAGYVAYVCADPPEPPPPVDWNGRWRAVLSLVLGWWWPFRRREEPANARKSAVATEAAPKRRRKSARPKRRTRPKPKDDFEDANESEVESSDDDETTDEDVEQSAADEDESTELHTEETAATELPGSSAFASRRQPSPQEPSPLSPPAPKAQPQPAAAWSEQDADDDSDHGSYRVDDPHGDPFKGLSKRQRRELKKQLREQQRQQRR